jgi:transcriptional regulator with XRE-family HTH domain
MYATIYEKPCKVLAMADTYAFSEWLQGEMNARGWSQSELARVAGVTRSAINGIVTGTRGPGKDLCMGIAHAFKIPPEDVFRVAGLLPPARSSQRVDRLMYQIEELDEEDQATLETFVGALVERKRKKNTSTKPATV